MTSNVQIYKAAKAAFRRNAERTDTEIAQAIGLTPAEQADPGIMHTISEARRECANERVEHTDFSAGWRWQP